MVRGGRSAVGTTGIWLARRVSVAVADDRVDLDEIGPLVPVHALESGVTNGLGWSRVEMVSSMTKEGSSAAGRMLDEDSTTSFQFSPEDSKPTLVIDLGKQSDCGRVSVLYDRGQAGRMKMWLADARGGSAAPENEVESRIGVADLAVKLERTLNDDSGRGRISFNEFRREGRYLILQWAPKESPTKRTFGIHEVAVFEHGAEGAEFSSPDARQPASEIRLFEIGGQRIGTADVRVKDPKARRFKEPPVSR